MRILVCYPGHAVSTIDVANGYYSALGALGHDVARFNYHTRLSFYDEALSAWERKNPNFEKTGDAVKVLASEAILTEIADFAPQFVLMISGLGLHLRAYELMHKIGMPYGVILTESPYADDVQQAMIASVKPAVVFTNEKTSAAKMGAVYLPAAYNPSVHKHVATRQKYHVFFQGTFWENRAPILELANIPALKAQIGGITYTGDMVGGIIDNSDLPRFYGESAICLNWHREHHGAYSLNPRAYEIAACGGFQLCDDTRGELFDVFGGSVATFSPAAIRDGKDLAEIIFYWLGEDDRQAEMVNEAMDLVSSHTFENRAESILVPAIEEILR